MRESTNRTILELRLHLLMLHQGCYGTNRTILELSRYDSINRTNRDPDIVLHIALTSGRRVDARLIYYVKLFFANRTMPKTSLRLLELSSRKAI